jgi:two-component system, cell cycle sensor histidine kinase and response regulator CckA
VVDLNGEVAQVTEAKPPSRIARRRRLAGAFAGRPALFVPLAYAVVAAAWIALSDRVGVALAPAASAQAAWSTGKGVAFVVVTAVALAALLRRALGRERRARNVLRRYQLLAEHGRDIMLFVAAEDGRILEANAAATHAYGYTREELRALTIFDLRDRATLGATTAQMAAAGSTGVRFETVHRRKDGSTFPVEVSSHGATIEGTKTLLSIVRDITRRKEAEQERERMSVALHQAAKLEAVGRLAGGIAHDFNNLLTVILSYAHELKQEVAEGSPTRAADLEEICAAGERARDLTRQLLTFARRQTLAPVALDVNTSVLASERLLRRLLGPDVELAVKLAPDLWLTRCDPVQMEQVVVNLAVNARDAMPAGGRIAIETSNLAADSVHATAFPGLTPGDYVRLVVQDSGTGMAPEVRERVFEPFFTTKDIGKGTGLGLATVYGIVQQMGGFIRVESEPGYGTSFEICMPRTLESRAVRSGSAPASA